MWAALRETPEYVRSVVAYYGVMDLQQARDVLPPGVPDEDLRDFSALHYLDLYGGKIAPTLVAKAGQDNTNLNDSIDRFVRRARELDAPIQLIEHPAGRHGFDVLNDDLRTREIIKHTLEFVKRET
jgi:acetyl esterase/lipase